VFGSVIGKLKLRSDDTLLPSCTTWPSISCYWEQQNLNIFFSPKIRFMRTWLSLFSGPAPITFPV
jgi:hypothetical protein